ncbi:MAG: pyridoxine 5'-phosphate synthase [gamma proteobacterium symbiont of Bathyaustriella thionipta]|nr:pyridoxine 5'-phosphate synthase [gamma proteobacterium symbiont of Bathyaustriella thionipta]MCU7949881.1 pyridoxine 5'-phosphate synthase [gamma proteobacterium symbiont of Bathyaustriella thionipta]MCU7952123.1 pyridoxine 5'-phosphate synthase [gamma proteobacterium symbiont of Bathyaustriella thionipta]MCU7956457.1 pyridoxine 5'-phosphate synthase [gamma proteobacterium symbiont of Bathyaustriella thionipta]MCU7968769.1 pyridoxine 5'-phosphate synthase [gamma proteobacterium symbiont of 
MSTTPSILLGVNIDHIATLRQARGTRYPDPVKAAMDVELAGADSITLHLREDRRHIQERDVYLINDVLQTRMNLEMAVTDAMLSVAEKVKPSDCCLVPEKREELTTEGGLDVASQIEKISDACQRLKEAEVRTSLFIDADKKQIDAAVQVNAPVIEIHTGHYADFKGSAQKKEFELIKEGVLYAKSLGLQVNAGHGLHYHNVQAIAALSDIEELNIGHAIIAQALFIGLPVAVKEMKALMQQARR